MKALNIRGYNKNMKVRVNKKKMNVVVKPVLDENIKKSPNVDNVPLKEEDKKSWVKFKKLAKGAPVASEKYLTANNMYDNLLPIKVDHPFVSVLHDFAIAAFNEVVHMYGKYGKSDRMSHSEVMSREYENMGRHYYFYMTIEAIEQGKLGVYDFLVGCRHIDGSTTLVTKELTDSKPTGKIAKMLPLLKGVISRYKTLKGMKKDIEIEIKLERANKSMKKGKDNHEVAARMIKLKKQNKALKGVCDLLYREIRSVIPKGWSKRIVSSSGYQYRPDSFVTGLTPNGSGYDYATRSMEYPLDALQY